MYMISLAMEDKIPYMGITISSFVAIHLHLTKLFYNIGELTSNPTHGGEIKFNILGCIYAFG